MDDHKILTFDFKADITKVEEWKEVLIGRKEEARTLDDLRNYGGGEVQ